MILDSFFGLEREEIGSFSVFFFRPGKALGANIDKQVMQEQVQKESEKHTDNLCVSSLEAVCSGAHSGKTLVALKREFIRRTQRKVRRMPCRRGVCRKKPNPSTFHLLRRCPN